SRASPRGSRGCGHPAVPDVRLPCPFLSTGEGRPDGLPGGAPHRLRSAARLLDHLGGLDLVADLDVVVLAEADTGFVVRAHLGDVVLEATQRLDGEAIGDDDAVADDARLGVARDR